jgi:hypothetical protein
MSDSRTTVKRLRVLETAAGVALLASFLVSFLTTVNEMTGTFATTSLSGSESKEAATSESINHMLSIHKAAVPIGIVAFLVWVACRRRLRTNRAITTISRDCSSDAEN